MRSPVWQKGFYDARVWHSQQYERSREYIHNNPVKRGLVRDADQYPYSSADGGFRLDPVPQGLKPVSLDVQSGTA